MFEHRSDSIESHFNVGSRSSRTSQSVPFTNEPFEPLHRQSASNTALVCVLPFRPRLHTANGMDDGCRPGPDWSNFFVLPLTPIRSIEFSEDTLNLGWVGGNVKVDQSAVTESLEGRVVPSIDRSRDLCSVARWNRRRIYFCCIVGERSEGQDRDEFCNSGTSHSNENRFSGIGVQVNAVQPESFLKETD